MLMLPSPLVVRPEGSMGLGSWRMETFQDHAEKSTQGHGKDGGLECESDQEPGWGILKEGQVSSTNTRSLPSGLYSLSGPHHIIL